MENCCIVEFRTVGNKDDGMLTPVEANRDVPFDIKRVYYIYDTPCTMVRGHHAHHELEQVLICVSGNVCVRCEDIHGLTEAYTLDNPKRGLFVGKYVWHEMSSFSEGTVLLVLASDFYDEKDYIRNYECFQAARRP